MSTPLLNLLAGVAGGGIVAVSQHGTQRMCRLVRQVTRRRGPRVVVHLSEASTTTTTGDEDAHAAYRAAQVRAFADHLAHGDDRLREQLRRFEMPSTAAATGSDDPQHYPGGEQRW
ncbi:hypothetical protein [Flexivirga caeni]|uniref:Uncharacterized protein n=1 Tax=Flexivirga caeni TaxID=2294115 RepID=A0A3M9LUM0_9MICO|nr:hypothetical protein [Flexivirga caeni]RNI17026.1 hypothetical protein EFY87_19740 [Flexivirga caeni]